jgi:hypothetical protein
MLKPPQDLPAPSFFANWVKHAIDRRTRIVSHRGRAAVINNAVAEYVQGEKCWKDSAFIDGRQAAGAGLLHGQPCNYEAGDCEKG